MYRVYCIELARENQDKADAIMHKYYVDGDIDVKHLENSRRNGMITVQYWFTCVCDDIVDHIARILKESGIELF
jgi:hypothetical protein